MKKFHPMICLILLVLIPACSTTTLKTLKVFISVDMEGLAGVVSGQECGPSGPDYPYFRKIMTLETNAAIEGALAAGATEIVVRDGHGSKNNIIPDLLNRRAKLLRGLTDRPENMMLGVDDSFQAVLLIGYHAKAGTDQGVIAHTSTGNVVDFSVNDVSLPEAGYNAIIAGLHNVPIVFVSGDNWICAQVKAMLGEVEVFETKTGMRTAELGLHPDEVRDGIRQGVTGALRNLGRYAPYKLHPPYNMVLKVKTEKIVYPGATRSENGVFTFTSSDFLEVMDAFNKMK